MIEPLAIVARWLRRRRVEKMAFGSLEEMVDKLDHRTTVLQKRAAVRRSRQGSES